MARTILVATRFGVFQVLAERSLTAAEVADACGMNPGATDKLLNALAGLGYVRRKNDLYELASQARLWLTADGHHDLTAAVLHRHLDMRLMEHSETYLKSGKGAAFHDGLSHAEWDTYLAGQHAQARLTTDELIKRIPCPENARTMLDLGGAHGLVADAMCKKHPRLQAVVVDLNKAVERVERGQASSRVSFEQADIRTQDLGVDRFDIVFAGNLLHHFSAEMNAAILTKTARSVRPGGVCVVFDFFGPEQEDKPGQITALLDFYFAVTSGGGTWTLADVRRWVERAGFAFQRSIKIRSAPGMALAIGRKPA